MKCLKMISIIIGFAISLVTVQGLAIDSDKNQSWNQKIKLFQIVEYKSRSDLYAQSKILLNQIEDDEALSYQQKLSLRRQVVKCEDKIASSLPELKLVGFRKTPINPADLKEGYVFEPEYR